jgi:hypothetical protein
MAKRPGNACALSNPTIIGGTDMRMMGLDFDGHAILCIGLAVLLLAGCGGNAGHIATVPANATGGALPYQHTFKYTDAEQSFVVPSGVTAITIVALGAAGAGYSYRDHYGYHAYFGRGGRVYAIVPVTQSERLHVFVGGQGSITGGFNGGGNPGTSPSSNAPGYGGGGASDVRAGGDKLRDRILVVGGGGGQGWALHNGGLDFGGSGGGAIGGTGGGGYNSGYVGGGGTGGTQRHGGSGGAGGKGDGSDAGAPGNPGALGAGGSGGNGGYYSGGYDEGGGGGGGGGGYYGGGGGGGGTAGFASVYGSAGGGGGGGSSYIEPYAYRFQSWQGWYTATHNGVVVFSWK